MSYKIVPTMDYESMVGLFVKSGLEIDPNEPAPDGLVTCFEMLEEETGERIGASGLCVENGEYVLRCVAVEEKHRGKCCGKALVTRVLEEAKAHDAKRIYLTAKVPGFYKKMGFHVIDREEAPIHSHCITCARFHNGCDSEIMMMEFD